VLAALIAGVLLIVGAVVYFKPWKKMSETAYRRTKNLAKILFVFLQASID
jgi:hypothetical protein